MKNKILLPFLVGFLGLSSAQAADWYDDSRYKNKLEKSYQFGFKVGTEYLHKYKELSPLFGINSNVSVSAGSTGVNLNLQGGIDYSDLRLNGNNEWMWDVKATIGNTWINKRLNLYSGVGVKGWGDISDKYIIGGMDYIYSEDIVLGAETRIIHIDGEIQHAASVYVTVPFNHF